MCIIIINKEGMLNKSILDTSKKLHGDGAGLMYSNANNELVVEKSLDPNQIIKTYKKIRKAAPTTPIVLHFRYATDGDIDDENCHPYPVTKNVAVVHNGILTTYKNRNTNMSDTRLFILDILQYIPEKELFTHWMIKLLQQAIDANKLVFMKKDGQIMIVNEDLGHWDEEKKNWFSNSTYKKVRKVVHEYPGEYNGKIGLPFKRTWKRPPIK